MVPYVLLKMDILAENPEITEEAFHEAVDPCLNRLRHLKDAHLTMVPNLIPHFRATLSVTGEKRCWFAPRTTSLSACT